MDPISLTLGVIGLGMSIFGGIGSAQAAGKAASISEDEARQEQNINDQKQQQMELSAKRQNLETIRKTQQAQAMSLNNATAQGAQFGSGLAGGQAQVTDQGLFNLQGTNQALQIGRNINQFNQNISADKQQMASVQSSMATDAGISSLGGAITKIGPIIGAFGKGFGGSSPTPSYNNPQSGSTGNPFNLNSLY